MADRRKKIGTTFTTHPLYTELLQEHVIRLIEVQPGDRDSQVVLRLLIVELEFAPEYEAISYVWGNSKTRVKVRCNGRILDITRNLDSALRRVRYPNSPRLIWADAICINQTCTRERNYHVTFMDRIYRQAKAVLVCMGKDEDGSASNVKLLVEEHNMRAAPYNSVMDMPELKPNDPLLDDTKWKSLGTLMKCDWFKRAWVLQEVGVAGRPIVLYGDEEFSYRNLMQLSRWITRCAPELQSKADIVFYGVHTDWELWSPNWRETAPYPEYDLLQFYTHARSLNCAKKHDHIYAFLGHPLYQLPDGSGPIFEPDYSERIEDVFETFTILLLEKSGLRVLSAVEHDEDTIKEERPSWVLSWLVELVQCSFGCWLGFHWDASASSKPKTLVVEGDSLQLRGFIVDTVSRVYQFSTNSDNLERPAALRDIQPEDHKSSVLDEIWRDIHDDATPYRYPQGKNTEIFGLTLVAGLTNYKHAEEDPEQHRANFAAYWALRMRATSRQDPPAELGQVKDGEPNVGDPDKFFFDMSLVCEGRTFIITENGYYGLAPWIAKKGDVCCIVQGSSVPFVLRRWDECSYKFLGEGYVHGVMFGETAQGIGHECKDIIIR